MADGEQGIKSASKTLNAFLDFCQKKFDLDDSRTVIFGYSQGAMQALDMSITRATPVRKVIALSGSLIPPNKEQIKKRCLRYYRARQIRLCPRRGSCKRRL